MNPLDIAVNVSLDRTLDTLRAQIGDCAVGAVASGLSIEQAVELSAALHLDPLSQARIAVSGGLLVGAEAGFEHLVEGQNA